MGVSGQQHAPAALYPRERPGTYFTGGWVGPRAGLDGRKISSPPGFDRGSSNPLTQSLYRLSYRAHSYAVLLWLNSLTKVPCGPKQVRIFSSILWYKYLWQRPGTFMLHCCGSRGLIIQLIHFHTHKQCRSAVPNRILFRTIRQTRWTNSSNLFWN